MRVACHLPRSMVYFFGTAGCLVGVGNILVWSLSVKNMRQWNGRLDRGAWHRGWSHDLVLVIATPKGLADRALGHERTS